MNRILNGIKYILPSPFTIAVLLTILTYLLAVLFTKSEETTTISYFATVADYWNEGVWGLLKFAMQMSLMLLLGHIIAVSKPFAGFLSLITKYCSSSGKAAFIITFFTILISLINWGLGLIFGAILARKIGEHASEQQIKINYPLIGACGYIGLMVWHGGLSGSAPIKAGESGHFLEDKIGVIHASETIFSSMNIFISVALLLIFPVLAYLLARHNAVIPQLSKSKSANQRQNALEVKGAEKLDFSKLGIIVGLLILMVCVLNAIQLYQNGGNILTPNFINLTLLGAALLMHGSFHSFLHAGEEAVQGTLGIMIQFPLYAGIMGIMKHSGMVIMISDYFVEISTKTTLPVFTMISAAFVNIFVPSGGGQWSVQGEIIANSSLQLGVPIAKNIMAMAYGDQLTNMLQPFWALPLLGITKLKASDIFPFTFIFFIVGFILFLSCLLFF